MSGGADTGAAVSRSRRRRQFVCGQLQRRLPDRRRQRPL